MTFTINTHDSWGVRQGRDFPFAGGGEEGFLFPLRRPLVQDRRNGQGRGVASGFGAGRRHPNGLVRLSVVRTVLGINLLIRPLIRV